jgi:fructokinase
VRSETLSERARGASSTKERKAEKPFGGVEAGGTKWVCAVGTRPDDIQATLSYPTGEPQETIAKAIEFFACNGPLAGIGIASFGPIDLQPDSPTWGYITTTPKPGWSDVELAPAFQRALGTPVAFDTDVNAAALAERRWGAAADVDTFVCITVGTGIGGGCIVGGQLLHGLLHPEMGHMRIPHDRGRDPFPGSCPYHGNCLEGLASGEAVRQRNGYVGDDRWDDGTQRLEAEYLALGLLNLVCALSPKRIILGGGVMEQPLVLPLVRGRLQELAASYFDTHALAGGINDYVVRPGLGGRAGVLGAIELARLG